MRRVQKRPLAAPLPIFNKSKQPRQALVAHPKNTGCASGPPENSYTQKPNSHNDMRDTSFRGWQQENRQPSYTASHSSHQQARFAPFRPQAQQPPRQPLNEPVQQSYRKFQPGGNSFQSSAPTPAASSHKKYGYDRDTSLSQQHTVTGFPPASTPVGLAREPTASMSAQLDKSLTETTIHKTKPKPSLRVLTATAQGMQHWSKFKQHSPLLFEVFGVLVSPAILVHNGRGKEFTIKTSDGRVKCLFWEMDRTLPHLVRGRVHRVLGHWDPQQQLLQCYTVRGAHEREEKHVRAMVEACDRSMRQLVSSLRET